MPVVIKELHVQVNVEDQQRNRPSGGRPLIRKADNDAIIRECVEKVVEIMKREEQR
jgi:hypothetical protein